MAILILNNHAELGRTNWSLRASAEEVALVTSAQGLLDFADWLAIEAKSVHTNNLTPER